MKLLHMQLLIFDQKPNIGCLWHESNGDSIQSWTLHKCCCYLHFHKNVTVSTVPNGFHCLARISVCNVLYTLFGACVRGWFCCRDILFLRGKFENATLQTLNLQRMEYIYPACMDLDLTCCSLLGLAAEFWNQHRACVTSTHPSHVDELGQQTV